MPSKKIRPNRPIGKKLRGHAAPKPTVDELLTTKFRMNNASKEFLKLDLQTALTFTGLALNTEDRQKKERNQHSARRAYDTILHLIERVTLTEKEAAFFKENLPRLKRELVELGEVF